MTSGCLWSTAGESIFGAGSFLTDCGDGVYVVNWLLLLFLSCLVTAVSVDVVSLVMLFVGL